MLIPGLYCCGAQFCAEGNLNVSTQYLCFCQNFSVRAYEDYATKLAHICEEVLAECAELYGPWRAYDVSPLPGAQHVLLLEISSSCLKELNAC
eukprot:908912-Pelagomonas_calceolata.AAC.3